MPPIPSYPTTEEAEKVVRAKTLIIVPATERIVNPEPALTFAKLIGAEVLKLHNGCSRLLSNCDIDDVNSAISQFWERK